MNIPIVLHDDSMRIPPEKIRILTDTELAKYGLNEDDPYYHDASIAKHAKRLGIPSSEYIQRLSRENDICKRYKHDEAKVVDCYAKIVNEGQLNYP